MKDRCFLIPKAQPITVRRTAAIGDVIGATVVADKLAGAGFAVHFECADAIQPLLRRHANIVSVSSVGKKHPDIDLDGCYETHPERTKRHFSEMFISAANEQLKPLGVTLGPSTNALAALRVSDTEKAPYLERLKRFPKPWVWICPRSQAWVNRTIPDYIWGEAAKLINGTKFWLGPDKPPAGIETFNVKSLAELPLWLSCADLLVTVDTGPMHIAAAVGCPVVAIEQASAPELHLSDRRDFVVVRRHDLDCLNCQKDRCPKSEHVPPCQTYPPELIADPVNARLRAYTSEDVSVLITSYRPTAERLRKCIEHVQEQVSEIVVSSDADGIIPPGVPQGPKIRYVKHRKGNLGFGKNANFGFRHTNGRYVLILNDDVFLNPDAVSKLRECMTPEVGLIGHLLYYPDGRIQHGGKYRQPGMRGWGHVDHLRHLPTVTAPIETENVTGASILVRREAFYRAKGFNEAFFLYAEDDAFCLQVRQKGYKVVYTPLAVGTHLESQTTKNRPDYLDRIREGNEMLWKYWGWWIEKNINRVPGTF